MSTVTSRPSAPAGPAGPKAPTGAAIRAALVLDPCSATWYKVRPTMSRPEAELHADARDSINTIAEVVDEETRLPEMLTLLRDSQRALEACGYALLARRIGVELATVDEYESPTPAPIPLHSLSS